MNIHKTTIVCKTFQGLEEVLAEELRQIGAQNVLAIKRGVVCDYSQEILYRANIELRTCLKVLLPVFKFESETPEALYAFAVRLKWEEIFNLDQSFAIDFSVNSDFFNHSQYAALKLKDAICDRFREVSGKRPDISIDNPDIQFHLHIFKDQITVSLDATGESLHKRGNRIVQTDAPINEVLAAGLILLSGWDRQSHFVDAMCGSGTIVIEAASYAQNIAPNLLRDDFCFKAWSDFDEKLYLSIKEDAKTKTRPFNYRIIGNDVSKRAINASLTNIEHAGFDKVITIANRHFEEFMPPSGNGTLIINPPYGERMEPEDINALYKNISDVFKKNYKGYHCWVISSNMDALKHLRLNPSKKIPLMNGKLECSLRCYEMYEGTKRTNIAQQ